MAARQADIARRSRDVASRCGPATVEPGRPRFDRALDSPSAATYDGDGFTSASSTRRRGATWRESHRLARHALSVCFAVALLLTPAAQNRAPSRVVAIGDVHGAYPQLVALLQQAGLIDASRRWIGGTASLVQTGDVVDRGAQTRECLESPDEARRPGAEEGRGGGSAAREPRGHERDGRASIRHPGDLPELRHRRARRSSDGRNTGTT